MISVSESILQLPEHLLEIFPGDGGLSKHGPNTIRHLDSEFMELPLESDVFPFRGAVGRVGSALEPRSTKVLC